MKSTDYFALNLQLFAGEGQQAQIGETGENVADAGQEVTLEVNEDEEFDRLINGRFKDKFTKKTQAIIDKRFKQTKELEAYKEKTAPLIEGLMEKYNIPSGEENRLLEMELSSEVTPVPEKAPEGEAKIKNQVARWLQESVALKEQMPEFDLRRELKQHKELGKLLLGGIDVKTAYEMVHREEIISDAMAYTADRVRKQVVDNIQAKGMRPLENGASSQGAVLTAVDVNSLTSQDILKILKQVENGANIKF